MSLNYPHYTLFSTDDPDKQYEPFIFKVKWQEKKFQPLEILKCGLAQENVEYNDYQNKYVRQVNKLIQGHSDDETISSAAKKEIIYDMMKHTRYYTVNDEDMRMAASGKGFSSDELSKETGSPDATAMKIVASFFLPDRKTIT